MVSMASSGMNTASARAYCWGGTAALLVEDVRALPAQAVVVVGSLSKARATPGACGRMCESRAQFHDEVGDLIMVAE
ncbi:hypothetical protein SAMN05421833_1285 [Microbispora rosea]|uniref:Uncharacterized protein n=1 Tax=Microbispora rosea TaxID=58117 RepID=A0A1N7GDT6_9ACTN|nr:hypothetical protein [Microbispora rosea]GIH50606.1 hypothetical protein Mro03_57850 [Microbispora rosea subsp. rosea]SIS10662.1 hypothetical protein SAMN05421833_1285 [Microbispora rosea]